ncbi:MAG: hypothetical protein H7X80_11135, partial [bacterium]|nr:hypothetical protein [Candidatus Kapabacteria bacterium]
HIGANPEPVALSRINPKTGAFQVVLGPSADYRFIIRSPRFLQGEKTVRTPSGSNYEEVMIPQFTVEPIPVGKALFMGRAFDVNSSALKVSTDLTKAMGFLKQSEAALITITVIPDGPTPKPAAKPAKPAKAKKGKKGAAVAPVAEVVTSSVDDQLRALAQSRAQAVKTMMTKEGISLTRIKWDVPETSAQLRAVAGRKENLVIMISGIDVEEEED